MAEPHFSPGVRRPSRMSLLDRLLGNFVEDFTISINVPASAPARIDPSSRVSARSSDAATRSPEHYPFVRPERNVWSFQLPREVKVSAIAANLSPVACAQFPDDSDGWFVKAREPAGGWGLWAVRASAEGARPERLSAPGATPGDVDALAASMIDRREVPLDVRFGYRARDAQRPRLVYANPASWSTSPQTQTVSAARQAAEKLARSLLRRRARQQPSAGREASARADVRWRRVDPAEVVSGPAPQQMRVCWAGQSTLLLQVAGVSVLVDPVFSQSTAAGASRLVQPPFVAEQLASLDAVLITHCHSDHLDVPSLRALVDLFDPVFLVPHGLAWLLRDECGTTKVEELRWWEDLFVGDNLHVTFVPAAHWSNRGIADVNESLWGGWVVRSLSPAISVYHSGDTAYCPAAAEIGQRLGPFDAAFVPVCNPAAPGAESMLADALEAAKIHRDTRSRVSYAVHWGTFDTEDSVAGEPAASMERARNELEMSAEEFTVLPMGKFLLLSQSLQDEPHPQSQPQSLIVSGEEAEEVEVAAGAGKDNAPEQVTAL